MPIALTADELGRLVCSIQEASQHATVTAADMAGAARDLIAALEDALRDGAGECYWREGGGEYRWMFRQSGENLRVAVLWSNGTLTGWEHVFWAEVPPGPFETQVRDAVSRLPIPAA